MKMCQVAKKKNLKRNEYTKGNGEKGGEIYENDDNGHKMKNFPSTCKMVMILIILYTFLLSFS